MRLKDAVLKVVKTAGGFTLMRASRWRRRRLMILCYHGVSVDDQHEWDPAFYVTQDHLRDRLRMLVNGGYTILPLAEATRRLYDGTLPARSVAITFDDGAADFATHALPVLREFNVPVTLYLSTYYCFVRLPVFDTMLSYVMWRGRNSGGDLRHVCEVAEPVPVKTDEQHEHAFELIQAVVARTNLNAEEKNALLPRVAAALGVDYEDIQRRELLTLMSPEVVRSLPSDIVDVQLHTHRHRTPRDRALFVSEIVDNIAAIHQIRGAELPLEHFCYPSGDYYGEFLPWLRETGVKYATTCVPEIASPDTDPLLIPRLIDSMNHSELAFESWVSGFAMLLPRRSEYRLDALRLQ
ncbi:MAG: Polysaccharide deacetylase [Gemmatimonadetes bacterium]|nr:Polysaccharide deacetylase [Gemmatimonadota bacterium]